MNNDKEKWMNEVFDSMMGSQRARPRTDLLAKIENRVNRSKSKIVPLQQWRYVAAAAILILFVNAVTLIYYSQNSEVAYENLAQEDLYNQTLVSSFQIYE